MLKRVIASVLFLFACAGIGHAETLDVFFGSTLRAEDVWGEVIEWRYPTGDTVNYTVKVVKNGNAATAFWKYPNGRIALRIEYTYEQFDFNQPLELVRGKTWAWDFEAQEMCFVDELEFNSRENRTLPLTMTHISSAPCSRDSVYPEFWELVPQFDEKGRPVSGTLKDISSGKVVQRHSMEYDKLGNVVKEITYNFKDYPNVENTFLYNLQGKINRIIQKFR